MNKLTLEDLLKKGCIKSKPSENPIVIDLPAAEFKQLWESMRQWGIAPSGVRYLEDNPAAMDTPEG